MATTADEDAVLSDVEGEDPAPLVLGNSIPELSVQKFQETLAELEGERLARKAAETAKSELQTSFNRLKVLAHETIKKRDESTRQRDEALREKEEALREKEGLAGELAEALRSKEEALNQRDELSKQRDENSHLVEEAVKTRDSLRSEIETTAQLLVNGIEKISGKVISFKNFTGGLPRSSKYSGLPAVAYGIIKRTDEIVEECLKHLDTVTRARTEVREQMEQRNYEIAIEVSQLEATINALKEDLVKRTSELENLEKLVAAKDAKLSEMDREVSEKLGFAEHEARELRQLQEEQGAKLRSLELKIELQRPLLIDQLNYISKTHDQLYDIIKMADIDSLEQADLSDTLFLPQGMDVDESVQACLDGSRSIHELVKVAAEKLRVEMGERKHEIIGLRETVARMVTEKQHIGTLLRSALSRKMASESLTNGGSPADPSSKASALLQVAENGLRDAGIDFRFDSILGNAENLAASEKVVTEKEDDEVFSLVGALENIVKASQLEIIELRHAVEVLRAESSLLKARLEAHVKQLSQKMNQIKELEEKERAANESVEGLMMDIAAAEEEISRWKVAAEQEAAAGRAIEEEFVVQLSVLKQELEDVKQALVESEKKLKFKEETADAAMAARDAAEKSLRLADTRAARLRERMEELTRQLEESDIRDDYSTRHNRQRYICWPWQWLGLNFIGYREDSLQQSSGEMELSEPLIL